MESKIYMEFSNGIWKIKVFGSQEELYSNKEEETVKKFFAQLRLLEMSSPLLQFDKKLIEKVIPVILASLLFELFKGKL